MGTIKDFEELGVWKMAREIVKIIYSDFRNCHDYCFRDQITRAGISIMNNISEGFSRSGDAEFGRFLAIAKGSAGEVKNMYYIAEDQNYLGYEVLNERRARLQKLVNSLGTLMKYLKESKRQKKSGDL